MNRIKVLENFKKYEEETKAKVNYGVENYRKGEFCISLADENGNPAVGEKIKLNQKNHEFKYGANIFMLDELETTEKNEAYKKYFHEAFNMATLPFYWNDLEPEPGKTRYEKDSPKIYRRPPIDLCMEFCEKYGIEPREHALAYEHFFPDWAKSLATPELKKYITRRFKEISERYAHKIPTIEVVNEMMWPVDETTSAFYKEDDFITWCFKEAEKHFPNNQLVINEHACMWGEIPTNRTAYYMMIQRAICEGARIDAVGMQYHMFYKKEEELEKTRLQYNPRMLYSVMDRYSDFGLPLQITEVTIPAYSDSAEDEEIQAEIIRNLYRIWFSHKNVEQIIYWNLADGYAAFASQGDMTAGENYYRGGLLRFDMSPKPAYYAIKELFEKEWHTETEIETDGEGRAYFKGFYGDYFAEIKGKKYDISTRKSMCGYVDGTKHIEVKL